MMTDSQKQGVTNQTFARVVGVIIGGAAGLALGLAAGGPMYALIGAACGAFLGDQLGCDITSQDPGSACPDVTKVQTSSAESSPKQSVQADMTWLPGSVVRRNAVSAPSHNTLDFRRAPQSASPQLPSHSAPFPN